jgi:hypothetical protein
MLYTDTNGQVPHFCNTAIYVLGILMESKPLSEIDFEAFSALALAMDAEELGLLSFI